MRWPVTPPTCIATASKAQADIREQLRRLEHEHTRQRINDLDYQQKRKHLIRLALGGPDVKTPSRERLADSRAEGKREQFEQELARVLARRLSDNYGSVYKVQEREESFFLVLLALTSLAAFGCAAVLWVCFWGA